jgi:hypothetical protein
MPLLYNCKTTQTYEENRKIEQIFSEYNEYNKLKSVETWLRMRPRKPLPRSVLDILKISSTV